MKVFTIENIPEFSKRDRIVVVGIIGKSAYRYPNKTTPLLRSVDTEKTGIECHYDEYSGVLYLHAMTYLDTNLLAGYAADLNEDSKSTEKSADASHWLVAAGELAADSCRVIALLFHLCQIVVVSSPTHVFDLGHLQLFKAIDAFRTELSPRTSAALTAVNAGGAWQTHGRCCCPRLLFHGRRAPAPLRRSPAGLKKLEHAVEDQLYFILRKARIITNVCAKSLFAIPKNEEFVYIDGDEEAKSARDVSSLVRGLVQRCGAGATDSGGEGRKGFREFLQGHIDMAFSEGFDDNVGKYAQSTSFFELPSAASWMSAARALLPLYCRDAACADGAAPGAALCDALATDVRFSQARCAKVLPIAQASYNEGLPAHYSSQHHAHKVQIALGVLSSMARGPLAGGARATLQAACDVTWRQRGLCEALSLTGNPCTLPDHDDTVEHSSGVRYVSACDCGRSKCARDDPYCVRAANHDFYERAAQHCVCAGLPRLPLPAFSPSVPQPRAATVTSNSQEANSASPRSESPAWSPEALSPGSDPLEPSYPLVRRDSCAEKSLSRQPSTTEYLPGMLHLASPPRLLPAFPSWSVVQVGGASLYSHCAGLPESLQPGLLPHTNYLQPWDAPVRPEANVWRMGQASARGRGKGNQGHQPTVKIFIGFEYECPRGHRMMMSSPDTPTQGLASTSAAVGARLAGSAMPLHAACLCRAAPPAPPAPPAQLARVHVVTPKAARVTLAPKVQPVPGGPIFVPQPAGSPPLVLSPSAYWILRLPAIYCDEKGPIPRPRTLPAKPGYLLAPLFGLQE